MKGRPRDRKVTIVTAAADLFAARGFAAVGIDDLGAAVGITGPAIYRHFRGKEAVLDAVVLGTIEAFVVDDDAAAEGVRRIVTDAVATALDAPTRLATYIRERHRLGGDARATLLDIEAAIARRWRGAIRAANPELRPGQVGDRHGAALGGLSAVALRRRTVERPRLDDLLAEALVAVVLAPATPTPMTAPRVPARPAPPPEVSRREEILAQALALFRARGFHGVGIDEIGEAAGITGPSVYFHYERKADILVDAFDRAGERVAEGTHAAVAAGGSPVEVVRGLAVSYYEVAVDNVDLIVVTSREGDAVPPEQRPRLAERRHEIRRAWVDALASVRPGLPEDEARTLVAGVFPLLNQLAARRVAPAEAVALATAWLGPPC